VQQSLTVRNFVVVKKAEIEIKKINIIIGPQANGKSLIAKLVYFFKTISTHFLDGIRSDDTKRELDKRILSDFEERFPRYSWEGTSFSIRYVIEDIIITIDGKRNAKGKTSLIVNYTQNLVKLYNSKKILYKKKLAEQTAIDKPVRRGAGLERHVMLEHVSEPLKREYSFFFCDPVFIPASRTFFANLQKNIFTFLASNLDIDPFLKEFGGLYENSKRLYKDHFFFRKNNDLYKSILAIIEAIVAGDYEYFDEQDWIVSKGRRINLANASSGQQESLPMLVVLSVYPFLRNMGGGNGSMFFIEEPEAHLFPTSQSHIVSLLSKLYDSTSTQFFMTSHSPYILSAFNNLILAQDAITEGNLTLEEFEKINGPSSPIKFDDVAAYTINNGVSESIADPEYRMIGGDMLDNVSEHFESVMNSILSNKD
jgi:hypothetical protein